MPHRHHDTSARPSSGSDASLPSDHGAGYPPVDDHTPVALSRRRSPGGPPPGGSAGKRSSGKVCLVSQQCTDGPRAARYRPPSGRRTRPHTRRRRPAPASGSNPGRVGGAPRLRRLPHPPGRRAHLWLAALVAGAVLAAVPGVSGSPDGMTGTASDYGLGVAADLAASGGIDDAGVRRSITEAEAQVRLGELAASRAARAPKTVL